MTSMYAAIFGNIPLVSRLFGLGMDNFTDFLYRLGYCLLGLLPLTVLAGIAHDVERQTAGRAALTHPISSR